MTKPEHLRFNTWFGHHAKDILITAGMPHEEVMKWVDQLYNLAESLWTAARLDGERHSASVEIIPKVFCQHGTFCFCSDCRKLRNNPEGDDDSNDPTA